jgi:phosphomannomutase / phosphoglucomutase
VQETNLPATARLEPHIFREYDIRGIVGVDLDAAIATSVGRAYAAALCATTGKESPSVAVGYDNRPSSPGLSEGLVKGLRAGGVDVVHVGMAPTPLVYWAEYTFETDGAIMITGSHNPPEWNGIKMTMERRALYGSAIQGLLDRIRTERFSSGGGRLEEEPVIERYVADVVRRFSLPRRVKVAVDCGNGTGALVVVPLLEALGADVFPLYCESDGTFPNHHPDPTVDENLVDLVELVRAEGCEVGIALDGDADRLGAVDENGDVVRGDLLLLLFGLDILKRGRGSTMVFDVKCSQVLPEVYAKAGGTPVMWKTGHSLIKEKMRETGAPLAGELSGHIMFADDYLGFDDALYDGCRLIDLLARSDRTLSEMAGAFPKYVSTPELRIEVTEETKLPLVEAAQEHFRQSHEVIEVDGARILFGDGWGLLRASNTQPVLVARFEARTEERLQEIRSEVEKWLRAQGVDV